MIQHTRWILQGGWKKKMAAGAIVFGSVIYIYYYTIEKMSNDSFYAELEMAEKLELMSKGNVAPGYNIDKIETETDD